MYLTRMTNTQTIPSELMWWAIRQKQETILRDYLLFRAYALSNGSYYKRPKNVSWARIKRLQDLGWIKKINTDHYQCVSVYKVALNLGLTINHKIVINNKELFTKSGNWKAYCLAHSEGHTYSRKKATAIKKANRFDRDGVPKRGNVNRGDDRLMSCRYMAKKTGLSHSTIANRRKRGKNNYVQQYDQEFDRLNLKKKKDVAAYVEMLKYSDLSNSEQEAKKNIIFDKSLKKYRCRTSTLVKFEDKIYTCILYNNSNRTYKGRYRKAASNPL